MRIDKGKKNLILFLIVLLFLIKIAKPVSARLPLTIEEENYIKKREPIRAASIDGGAPLHYKNSKGEITGIAISTLDLISDMTGLIFEYELYDSIDIVFNSKSDIIFGITPNYAPENMILSDPYLKSETILFVNSSIDSKELEDKIYASIKGANLPDGVKEENRIFYNSREETLDAVEKGEADYGYGNEYSLAFYKIQNSYKNIITIPKAKESREYAIGFPKEDKLLISIINKSISSITDNQMNQIILDTASKIERKITFQMIMDYYGKIIFAIIAIVIGILVWNNMLKNKAKKDLVLQNKRYKILSNISNEYLFEYEIATDRLKLTEKIRAYFKTEENLNNLISLLKNKILKQSSNDEIQVLELFNQDGNQVIFKIIKSIIYDDRGRAQYIVGKIIDMSQESAEKEKLIRKSEIDGLTEIYNDVTMKKLIEERMQSRNSKVRDAFILIDCDKFKEINDKYGHLEGDKALKNVSHALKINFRETDIIGRIGGDEFGVYMKNVPSIDFVQKKCEALIVYVQEMDKVFNLKLSIGIALLEDEKTHDELFKKADDALYEAKKTGGGKSVLAK